MFKTFTKATLAAYASAASCVASPGTMDYWCVDAGAPCIAGFKVTDHTCANAAQECCEHYCFEGYYFGEDLTRVISVID
jgi:hypothetical protein